MDEVESGQGCYLARSISAVDEIHLTDVKLSADQWEELGKELKQPHNKLRYFVL